MHFSDLTSASRALLCPRLGGPFAAVRNIRLADMNVNVPVAGAARLSRAASPLAWVPTCPQLYQERHGSPGKGGALDVGYANALIPQVDAATKAGERMLLIIFKKFGKIGYFHDTLRYFRDTLAIPKISISKPWHCA